VSVSCIPLSLPFLFETMLNLSQQKYFLSPSIRRIRTFFFLFPLGCNVLLGSLVFHHSHQDVFSSLHYLSRQSKSPPFSLQFHFALLPPRRSPSPPPYSEVELLLFFPISEPVISHSLVFSTPSSWFNKCHAFPPLQIKIFCPLVSGGYIPPPSLFFTPEKL